MKKLSHFISRLKENTMLKKVLYYGILASMFLYVFSIPSFSGRDKYNLISYFFMGVLICFTLSYTLLHSKFRFKRIFIVPLLFVAYALVGTIVYSHEFRRWLTLVLMALTMLVLYYAFLAINNSRLIFKIMIFAFLVFGFYFLFVYRDSFKNLDLSFLRLGDYFDNVNTIGFYFSISFSFSLYVGLLFKKKIELLYLLPALLFFFLGFLTGSRAFVMVTAVGTLFILFFRIKKHKWLFFIIVGALILSFVILMNIPFFSFLKDQFDRMMFTLFGIGNSKVDTSTVQRVIYLQYAWSLAGKNLLLGYGCNGFAIYSGVGTYSHNNFAEVMCNFGILGFVIYHLAFLLPILYVINSKEKDSRIVFVLVAIYFIRSFFGVSYYTKDSYLVLALCFYLINGAKIISIGKSMGIVMPTTSFYEVSI